MDKINIIGSQIYRTENEQSGKSRYADPCIMHPSDLFDELHSFWLLDFVKHLIEDFVAVAKGDHLSQIAIVLDNSPGFIGIAPEIHNWLTDLGPKIGKLLFVSSLDVQDIHSCNYAIGAVHGLFQSKWKTSRQYLDHLDPQIKTDNVEDIGFYFRLATSTDNNVDTASLAFYSDDNHEPQDNFPNSSFVKRPERYIAVVFNRVPRAIKKGDILIELMYSDNMDFSSIMSLLLTEFTSDRFKNRMVCYNEYIENQFLFPLIQGRRRSLSNRKSWHMLIKKISKMEDSLKIRFSDIEKGHYESFKNTDPNLPWIERRLYDVNLIIVEVRANMAEMGLSDLARLIDDEWLPGRIIPTFRIALSTLLRDSKLPSFDIPPIDIDYGFDPNVAALINERYYEIRNKIVHDMTSNRNNEMENEPSWEILFSSLFFLFTLSLFPRMSLKTIEQEFYELFKGMLSIELTRWSRDSVRSKRKRTLQEFLAREPIAIRELRNDIEFHMKSMRLLRHYYVEHFDIFVDFYRSCTYAQARLIDFETDSLFVLQLIRFMIEQSIEMYTSDKGNQFPYVRGIAEKVIVEKTMTHREARKEMSRALQTAEYFSEFETVLKDILVNWEVDK